MVEYGAVAQQTVELPPALLAYAGVHRPRLGKLAVSLCLGRAGLDETKRKLEEAVTPLMAELKMVAGFNGIPRPSVENWLMRSLRAPKPEYVFNKWPSLILSADLGSVGWIRQFDAAGNLLDPRALKLGSGSIVQPSVKPALWIGGVRARAELVVHLHSLRILKRTPWDAATPTDKLASYDGVDFDIPEVTPEDRDLAAFLACTPEVASDG